MALISCGLSSFQACLLCLLKIPDLGKLEASGYWTIFWGNHNLVLFDQCCHSQNCRSLGKSSGVKAWILRKLKRCNYWPLNYSRDGSCACSGVGRTGSVKAILRVDHFLLVSVMFQRNLLLVFVSLLSVDSNMEWWCIGMWSILTHVHIRQFSIHVALHLGDLPFEREMWLLLKVSKFSQTCMYHYYSTYSQLMKSFWGEVMPTSLIHFSDRIASMV